MSDIAKKVGAPALPAVNLLPKDIAEKRQMRAVQFTALLAIAIAIGVVVVGYVLALGATGLANNELVDARTAQDVAIATRDGKTDVYAGYRGQEIEEYTLAQIGFGDIEYRPLSTAMLATADGSTNFDEVTFSLPSAYGFNGVRTDPVLGGGVGSVSFLARAEDQVGATALVERIEAVPGLARVDAAVEVFTTDGGTAAYWQVEGSAVITSLWLTERLLPVEGVTGLNSATVTPGLSGEESGVAPSPSPSPEPSVSPEEED